MKPRLLDLFCGAGGATKGYQEAGFYVVGVDIDPQPHYCGDKFVQMDALDAALEHVGGSDFDAIHASPPCQAYSATRYSIGRSDHPELIERTRDLLQATGLPYVIENVPGAPLIDPLILCGSGLGLPVIESRAGKRQLYRHRLFECSFPVMAPPCSHRYPALGVYGHGPWDRDGNIRRGGYQGTAEERRQAMGIDWMNRDEVSQAIPPVYTEHIGSYLLAHLQAEAVAA